MYCRFFDSRFVRENGLCQFSNTHPVIDNTNEAVRICGENNVAAVTTTGFSCVPSTIPVVPSIQ
jgi:hypothetical protein